MAEVVQPQKTSIPDLVDTNLSTAVDFHIATTNFNKIVNDFVEKHDMVHDWQAFIAELQKEQENAVQESETESLDVQEQTKDGEEVGEGDAESA